MKRTGVTIAWVFCGAVGIVALVQSPKAIDYDTFCKLSDVQARRAAFVAATPDNKAELARTQVERWRDANKAGMTPQQVELLSEMVALITPAAYTPGTGQDEARTKMRAIEGKMPLLSTVYNVQTMQPNGGCLPKAK
jgi:hypothetical protein